MASKKIVTNAFEQVIEASKDMAKSSAQQIKETFNPWDMIRNSFSEENPQKDLENKMKSKEAPGKGDKHTPLNFDKLNKSYADQDKQKIDAMKQRLFQLVKNDSEKTDNKTKQQKFQKERDEQQQEMDQRREAERRRQQSGMISPQGKLKGGKRKRPAAEPQPAESKPGSSKQ
jgi:hypothetical protein